MKYIGMFARNQLLRRIYIYNVWKVRCLWNKKKNSLILHGFTHCLGNLLSLTESRFSFPSSLRGCIKWIQSIPTMTKCKFYKSFIIAVASDDELRLNILPLYYVIFILSPLPVIWTIKFTMKRRTVAFIVNRLLFTVLINRAGVISSGQASCRIVKKRCDFCKRKNFCGRLKINSGVLLPSRGYKPVYSRPRASFLISLVSTHVSAFARAFPFREITRSSAKGSDFALAAD